MSTKHLYKRLLSSLGITFFAILAILFAAAPAQAATYVDGWDTVTDDWADNPQLCVSGCENSSDAVTLWQAVLWADGKLAASQIDGGFGPITRAATEAWQRAYGLDDDGRVGPLTWGKADNNLVKTYMRFLESDKSRVTYLGDYHGSPYDEVLLKRGTSSSSDAGGVYYMYDKPANKWKPIHRTYETISNNPL